MNYLDLKSVLREAFAGQSHVPFQELPSLPEDLSAGVAIRQMSFTRQYDGAHVRADVMPVAVEIAVTLDWKCREADHADVDAALFAAYRSAVALAVERFASAVRGGDRTEIVVVPNAEVETLLLGTEIWVFGE